MSLTLKGRVWKDGNYWRAEIRDFDILAKAREYEEAIQGLTKKLDEIAPGLNYELTTDGAMDGPIIWETDQVIDAALLIIKRRLRTQ